MILGIGSLRIPYVPLSIITLLVTYTIAILPTQSGVGSGDLWVLTVITTAILFVFVYVVFIAFVIDIANNGPKYRGWGMVLGVGDVALSLIHVLSLIMYATITTSHIVSGVPNVHFANTPLGETGYELFYVKCISNTIGFFFSAGIVNSFGTSALGVFHDTLTIVTGSFVTLFAFSLAVSRLTTMKRIKVQNRI